MGTEKSSGPMIYSLSGRIANPGQYECGLGITLRELIELAGGMQPGHNLRFWTPGGSSTPLLTAEHIDIPLDFEGVAGGRLDPGHHGDADLLRPGLPGLRDLAVAGVLPPRVVRQVHPVPRGQLLDGPGYRRILSGQGTLRGPGHPAGHRDNILGRSFCGLGDGATSPVTSSLKYFKQDYLDYIEGRTAPRLSDKALVGAH